MRLNLDRFLEISDVSLSFGGIQALNQIQLNVQKGDLLAIIGPNGSGKTSLFNCLTGFYKPDIGSIKFEGQSLLELTPDAVARRGVVRTFQNLRLFQNMSVLDNIMLGRHIHFKKNLLSVLFRNRSQEISHRAKCEELIEFLNLESYRMNLVGDCPYGVQKKVDIGRALAMEPRLLLLDEPVSGLTNEEKEEVTYWIHEIHGRMNLTIILVEHDLRVVTKLASRMLAMDHGEKIAEGSPSEVQRHPEVIKAYLGG